MKHFKSIVLRANSMLDSGKAGSKVDSCAYESGKEVERGSQRKWLFCVEALDVDHVEFGV